MKDWQDVTSESMRREGYGEKRYLKKYGAGTFVSVLYRMTGFGYMEWETAICFHPAHRKYNWKEKKLFMVRGDRREELDNLKACQLMQWYRHHQCERNSFDTLVDRIVKAKQ